MQNDGHVPCCAMTAFFLSFLKKLKDLGKLCTAGRRHSLALSGSSA